MSNDKKYFPKGLFYKEPHPNAPDFVKGQVSVRVDEFKQYLGNVKGDWLNIDLKISRDGKPYAEVNTFKPEKRSEKISEDSGRSRPMVDIDDGFDDMDDDLPF